MTTINLLLCAIGLFAGMLLCLEIGRSIGRRRLGDQVPGEQTGLSVFEGAVFALMGLLLAFTFSGAESRFDEKRNLIVQEANAVGTAYMRIDLLPASSQPRLRDDLRSYVDARLAFYQKLADPEAAHEETARATALQKNIWSQAVLASQETGSPAVTTLVLSSLDTMFDIRTIRAVALQTHPPPTVFLLLIALALICSLFAGYGTAGKNRSWIHMVCFAAILAVTVYVIFDLEYPRGGGWVRLDVVEQVLVQVRSSMN